jgi:hypothetical protein
MEYRGTDASILDNGSPENLIFSLLLPAFLKINLTIKELVAKVINRHKLQRFERGTVS